MKPMYINSQWVTASDGTTIEVFNPASAELIDSVPNGSPQDALKAIEAAKHAFKEWRWTPGLERCEMLHEAARELGEEGLESFLETKHVHWDFSDAPKPFWYPYS